MSQEKQNLEELEAKIVTVLNDWDVENPKNLFSWIELAIKRYGEERAKEGRSEIYKVIEKMKL